MTNAEKETIIRWDEEADEAVLYTCDSKVAARWRKLGIEMVEWGHGDGWQGTCPKRWVRIKKPRIASEAQIAVARAAAAKSRAAKLALAEPEAGARYE